MDFPSSLHPSLFTTGLLGLSEAPDLSFTNSWKDTLSLSQALPLSPEIEAPPSAKSLFWVPETPGPLPLLPPGLDPWAPGVTAVDLLFRGRRPFRRAPRAVFDATEQISRFLWDHGDVAFAPLGKLMLENFKLEGMRSRSKKKTVVSVETLLRDLDGYQPWGQVARERHQARLCRGLHEIGSAGPRGEGLGFMDCRSDCLGASRC